MPEMAVPSFEEWLKAEETAKTSSLMSSRPVPQRESINEKISRMRKWSNTGVRTVNATRHKILALQKPRRERISARLAQRAIVQGQEMIKAREWTYDPNQPLGYGELYPPPAEDSSDYERWGDTYMEFSGPGF